MKLIDKIIIFFINIATSGKYSGKTEFVISDYLVRYVLLNFICFFGIIILLAYNVLNFQKELYNIVITSTGMLLIAIVCIVLARTKVPQIIPSLLIMIFYFFLCVWLTYIKQVLGLNFLFIYVYPLLAIILLGLQYGVILSSILILSIILIMLIPGLSHYYYHVESIIRIFVTYIMVFFVMIVIEFTRKTKDKLIEKQRCELQNYNKNLIQMVKERTQDILNLQDALLKTMAELVEFRDDVTGGHIERTYRGTSILLNEIEKDGFYGEEIKNWNKDLLLQSCQLHDIGKISINDSILKKPAELNKEEFEEMKKHTVIGEQIIDKIEELAKKSDFLKYARIFAASHHEKWDGSGYPQGLKGNEIPLLGRIMAIADVYDALTSVRPYKNAFSHEKAVEIIIEQKGTQFDPKLVEKFIKVADQFRK